MKKFLFLMLYCCNIAFAQQNIHKCYTMEYTDYLDAQYPGTKANIKSAFEAAKFYADNHLSQKSTKSIPDTIFRIPVVFHVVYNGAAQNISESLLESQIDVLNEDFQRLNADTNNTRAIFQSRAGNVGFEFFLATIDPDGNPTSGITRTETSTTFSFFNLDAMKENSSGGKDAWDVENYMNVWVCNLGGAVLGFAYPPDIAPNWPNVQGPANPNFQGVVIHHEVVGRNNPLATGQLSIADQGRTAVHEVGHFFGLRHIWGDSGNPFTGAPDCNISEDDGFSDTPHMGNNSQQTGCSFSKNTCTNGESPDEPDMVENYMDYSTETCQNMFTQQQADLMRSMAIIGRPNLAYIIKDDVLVLNIGDWIVVNGTDTFLLDGFTSASVISGDEVMFLNENNGYNYISTGTYTFSGNQEVSVTEDGNITFVSAGTNSVSELYQIPVSFSPNPSRGTLSFRNPTNIELSSIKVLNVNGQVVQNIKLSSSENQILHLDNLNNGIYFLRIENQSQLIGVKKISIIH